MAYYTYTQDPIGAFYERDTGNYFEFSVNDETFEGTPVGFALDYPHKVWVGGRGVAGMTGWRYAKVLKTVAYLVIDEDEYGLPVVEKWQIKNYRTYGEYAI